MFLFSGDQKSYIIVIFRLKQANIACSFKKGNKNFKENYRLVSILPNIWKILGRFKFKQISNFMETFFPKRHCGFQKGCEHTILSLIHA